MMLELLVALYLLLTVPTFVAMSRIASVRAVAQYTFVTLISSVQIVLLHSVAEWFGLPSLPTINIALILLLVAASLADRAAAPGLFIVSWALVALFVLGTIVGALLTLDFVTLGTLRTYLIVSNTIVTVVPAFGAAAGVEPRDTGELYVDFLRKPWTTNLQAHAQGMVHTVLTALPIAWVLLRDGGALELSNDAMLVSASVFVLYGAFVLAWIALSRSTALGMLRRIRTTGAEAMRADPSLAARVLLPVREYLFDIYRFSFSRAPGVEIPALRAVARGSGVTDADMLAFARAVDPDQTSDSGWIAFVLSDVGHFSDLLDLFGHDTPYTGISLWTAKKNRLLRYGRPVVAFMVGSTLTSVWLASPWSPWSLVVARTIG